MSAPVLVALTGPPGSGKSTVAACLRQEGFVVLDADALARSVMEQDPEVRRQLQERFGAELFAEGRLRAEVLADKIFGTAPQQHAAREFVEELVHPKVLQLVAEEIERLAAAGHRLILVEAALIYETGLDEAFDYVVVVDAPEELRHARLRQRGWTPQQIAAREAAQYSARTKRQRADIVLDNSGSLEQLRHSCHVLAQLLQCLPSRLAAVEGSASSASGVGKQNGRK